MPSPEVVTGMIAKILWPFLGSILALIVIPPKTRSEAARRGVASAFAGAVAGPTLHEWMGLTLNYHNERFTLILAAFLSWWILGALPKLAEKIMAKYGS